MDFILIPRVDVEGVTGWQIDGWPRSLKLGGRLKPVTKGAV
jgi:hypothetical protein